MFYLHHIFRSFLPLQNPIGFGGVDFLELFLAITLVSMALLWPRLGNAASRFAARAIPSMLLLFVLPIALRVALLRTHPIPRPAVADDFSYALLGDTLAHLRLANPPHPLHRFFETFFVIQEPSYSSIYPVGQGIVLAMGQLTFGNPWWGIAISIGVMCALCYWMLRGWTTPEWALLGGFLAVIQFGPLNQWMNSYWGGAVSAIAGCLVFGALGRLRREATRRNAILLGIGLGLHILTRPFEALLLLIAIPFFINPRIVRVLPYAALALLPAVGITLVHNKRVTGHWATLPYQLSREQYGVPASFTFQPNPTPHRELTREQQLDYQVQSAAHDRSQSYFARLLERARFYRFFWFAPLYIAALAFLFVAPQYISVVAGVLIFAVGTNFYPFFYSHYIAALTSLFLLIAILGLQKLGSTAARWIVFLCVAQFALWYTTHLIGDPSLWQLETWDAIHWGPDPRLTITRQLDFIGGQQLVFVRYGPRHTFKEWVYNGADIDRQRIVWARDLGPIENEKLLRYYPDRRPWLLEVDSQPLTLKPYASPAPEPPPASRTPPARPHLKFEEVH